jgi:hypothetical protein
MWCKRYGRTGKDISVVSFGGMRFADPEDIDANAEVVLHGYRRGINYFDTAPGYCRDHSEDIIGAAVRQMKPGTFYVSTKCSKPDGGELRESLERSLRRLNVERIHFFHVWCLQHPGDWQKRKAGGAVAAALKARQEGLIEHLAASAHLQGTDLREVLAEGVLEGVTLGYSAIDFPYRQEAVDAAGRLRLGVVTMNPLGGGLIPRNADRFAFIRGRDDPSVVAAALRFNVSNPSVTSALVGLTTKQHVDEAVAAVEGFTPYGAARAEQIREHILDAFEGLCTGCGYCLPCPEGIDVPRMMDAYNQRILRGREPRHVINRLKWHWGGMTPADARACSLCGACEERCTQHLPIRDRMQEIAALAEQQQPSPQAE